MVVTIFLFQHSSIPLLRSQYRLAGMFDLSNQHISLRVPCSLPSSKVVLDFFAKIKYNTPAKPIKFRPPFSDEAQRLRQWDTSLFRMMERSCLKTAKILLL